MGRNSHRRTLHALGCALAFGLSVPASALEPPTLLTDSPAEYPEARRQNGDSQTVELELSIDEHGHVTEAALVAPGDEAFDSAAVQAAKGLLFQPASLEGKAVAVRIRFIYRFNPPPKPAQEAPGVFTGQVRAKGNRKPLWATLLREGFAPVETDGEGRFRLEWPPGEHVLTVTSPGHKRLIVKETLKSGESLDVIYVLEPDRVNDYETIVRDERARTEVSRITLHEQEIRDVAGTMGDPFRVVMTLPGVSTMLSGVAYPVVRGSQPAETGYFLDGIRVPILFHLFLGPAVVHPEFLDAIDFYSGAPPPTYGRLMGGVIEAKTSRPREDRLRFTASADLLNAGLFVEYPFKQTGTSVSVAGRTSYSPWLVSKATQLIQGGGAKPTIDYYDYQARVDQKLGAGNARLFAFGSWDLSQSRAEADTHSVLFHRADMRYQVPIGQSNLEFGATYGLDRLEYKDQAEVANSVFDLDTQSFAGRASWNLKLTPQLQFQLGGDFDHRRARKRRLYIPVNQENDFAEDANIPVALGTFVGAYAQLVWGELSKWSLVPGLRVDRYHLQPNVTHIALEPRITLRRALTEGLWLKGAAGLYHQPPATILHLPVFDIAGLEHGLQKGAQVDVGLEWTLARVLQLNLDLFYNPLMRTVELDPFSDRLLADLQVRGALRRTLSSSPEDAGADGYSYGLEVLLRRPMGDRWFGWISYTLQRSVRLTRFDRFAENGELLGRDTAYLPFGLDQTHTLNGVLSFKVGQGWTLGAAMHFNTGRPETGGITSQTQRMGQDMFGAPAWIPVDRDKADRLPGFFRLDARVANAWTFDTFTLEAYLDFFNLTLSKEVDSYRYGQDPQSGELFKVAEGAIVALPILGVKGAY